MTKQWSTQVPAETDQQSLIVRLATTPDEVAAAQALRYRVFYQEMNATNSDGQDITGRDIDNADAHCDHLLVIDPNIDIIFHLSCKPVVV